MEKIIISTEERKILGKKVKNLRKEGKLPANVFGKDFKSKSIQVAEADFRQVFKEAGETGVVDVKLGKETYPALIHKIQLDPRDDAILHVDFHKVNLKEKITTHVPIVTEGESSAEKSGVGLILQTINELEVESLPTDIPAEIKIDVSKLEEVGQSIHVKDLKVDRDKVEVKNDPEDTVITVQTAEMKEEETSEEVSPGDIEATAEKGEEEEAVEGEAGPEKGEVKPKEKGKDKEEKPAEADKAPVASGKPEGKTGEKPQGKEGSSEKK